MTIYFKIFLRNSTTTDPYQQQVQGCGNFCSLTKLKNLLKNNIPQNWTAECEPKDPNFKESLGYFWTFEM